MPNPTSTPLSAAALAGILLIAPACRGEVAPARAPGAGLSALGQFPDLDRDLRAYAAGRQAEIGALEAWLDAPEAARRGSLDSIGAVASELRLEQYVRLANEVDQALLRWGDEGKLDQRLRRLDSLRVERKVLLVRLTIRTEGSDR